ncbi:MAG: sensor histidine kinase [Pseudomonadota bacterium]
MNTSRKNVHDMEMRVLEQAKELRTCREHLALERAERKRAEDALRELAARQESIKEDERKRIAREIHDDLGQNLLALRIDVSMLHVRTGAHPRLNQKVAAALRHIDATMKTVRAIINDLRPAVLELGLHAAIDWQLKEFQRRSGIRCKLNVWSENQDLDLDEQRATALFRILQESLVNVSRHAQASHVNVTLCSDESRLLMRVADDGIGMPAGCRRKGSGFGLLGISERISTLGGALTIDSRDGSGTTLTVSIPVDTTSKIGG